MSARAGIGRTALGALLLGGVALVAPAAAQEPTLALGLHVTAPLSGIDAGVDLVAGIAAGAGPGYDPGLDARAIEAGALQAWILGPATPAAGHRLARDFRDGAAEEVFAVEVAVPAGSPDGAVAAGAPVTLGWDPPATGGVCAGRTLTLVDPGSGDRVDMTAARDYTFAAPGAGATRALQVIVGAPGTAGGAVPPPPDRVLSPSHGRREVLLVWSPGDAGVAGYQVERTDRPGDPSPPFTRLTDTPLGAPRFVDTDVAGRGTVGYRVIAVSGSGCASPPSDLLVVTP